MTSTNGDTALDALDAAIEVQTDVGSSLLPGNDEVISPALRDAVMWEPELRAVILAVEPQRFGTLRLVAGRLGPRARLARMVGRMRS